MISFRENEHTLFEIRKHWFVIATEISVLFLLAFVPLLIPQILDSLSIDLVFKSGGGFWPIYIFFYSFWLLILWMIGFVFWTNYYLDVWIVTNEKIIDVEQVGMFKREVSILHLDRIQDITTEINGIIGTLMKFGNLHVQTAGQQREFIIHNVANPDEVGKKVNEILMKYKDNPISETKTDTKKEPI